MISQVIKENRNLLTFRAQFKLIINRQFSSSKKQIEPNDEFSTSDDLSSASSTLDLEHLLPEAEEKMEKERLFREYIERKRDVSRFSKMKAKQNYQNSMPTYSNLEDALYLKSNPNYFRKIYSKFGKESNIEPGIAWPHKHELNEMIRIEKELDLSLEQKIDVYVKRVNEKINSIEKMENDVDESLKKTPKLIEAFYQRTLKKDQVQKEKLAKRQEILDQAREFYGFEVDLRDTRIQEMVKKLQDEKKAEERQKKKEEEKKKLQTNLLQSKMKESDKLLKNLKEEAISQIIFQKI